MIKQGILILSLSNSIDKSCAKCFVIKMLGMSRKKIAAGNWKMNTTAGEGEELLNALMNESLDKSTDIIICAPFTHLAKLAEMVNGNDQISVAAQNMSDKEKGAYTGEISADMLLAIGVEHVVIGHSERREYFNESDELLGAKLKTAISKGLTPIFCCGEQLAIRKNGTYIKHVLGQLSRSFEGCSKSDLSRLVIAYEPIWAIGTGETASPEQAEEMQKEIRAFLIELYDEDLANNTPILYGGSVKPNNAKDIFSKPNVDGGLVGGASLDAKGFGVIVNSFE